MFKSFSVLQATFMNKNWKYKIYQLAEESINQAKKKGKPVVCRCGETPGGTKHIGNFNDNIRSYFIYLAVKEKGYPAKHIQTRDNMDPFRKLPGKFFDLNCKWHKASSKLVKKYEKYVGMPVYFIPDPLGCCDNYAEHFRKIYEQECLEMGLQDTEYVSTYDLYSSGKFNPYLQKIFENIEKTRKINLSIEGSKPKDYIPVWAICENCKKITGRIKGINLEYETVDYTCTGRNLTTKYPAKGCGYEGTVDWKNGNTKMDWEFEWPAQMLLLETTIEPFGKEHFIGSWPFSKQVISEIYGEDLPLVFFYEYFLVKKIKMATRHGNVTTLSDLQKFLEPEVIRYIYTKRPEQQRSLNFSNVTNIVNEFDYAEKVWFGKKQVENTKKKEKIMLNYEFACLKKIPQEFPNRIAYFRLMKLLSRYTIEEAEDILFKKIPKNKRDFNSKRLRLVNNYLNLRKNNGNYSE
jgi:lysyl-tRNA synthetase, class I